MKSTIHKQRSSAALAKKIESFNHSQDQARYDRKLKRTLHDFKDVSTKQLFTSGTAYDIA